MSDESVLLIALAAVSCLNFLLILLAVDAVWHAVVLSRLAIIRATSRIEGELADIRETIERIDADLRCVDDDNPDDNPDDKYWERN